MIMKPVKDRTFSPMGTFGNFFDDFFTRDFNIPSNTPSINIIENEGAFRIELAAPGLEKTDFNIQVEKELLKISVEKKSEQEVKEENFTRREFNFSTFSKSFHIPDTVNAEAIAGNYENGVLSLSLPKKEEDKTTLSKTIEIK